MPEHVIIILKDKKRTKPVKVSRSMCNSIDPHFFIIKSNMAKIPLERRTEETCSQTQWEN